MEKNREISVGKVLLMSNGEHYKVEELVTPTVALCVNLDDSEEGTVPIDITSDEIINVYEIDDKLEEDAIKLTKLKVNKYIADFFQNLSKEEGAIQELINYLEEDEFGFIEYMFKQEGQTNTVLLTIETFNAEEDGPEEK